MVLCGKFNAPSAIPTGVIFDIGRVLYDWDPRFLYERLIPDNEALETFLRDVVTHDWHFQHDAGRPFAETSAELIERYPEHEALISAWGPRFLDSIGDPICRHGRARGRAGGSAAPRFMPSPIFPVSSFRLSVRAKRRCSTASCGIVVSGDEKLVKPDPAIYHLALDRFGLDPAQTVFIDDNEANVAAAAAIGLIALHFTGELKLRGELTDLGLLAQP